MEALSEIASNPVPISALYKTNMNSLKQEITDHLKEYVQASFSLPISNESMSFLSWLFSRANIRDLKYEGENMNIVFEAVPLFADKVRGCVEQLGGTFNT